jgi:hypothetical protein
MTAVAWHEVTDHVRMTPSARASAYCRGSALISADTCRAICDTKEHYAWHEATADVRMKCPVPGPAHTASAQHSSGQIPAQT